MHARRSGQDWFVHFEEGEQLHEAYRAFAEELLTADRGLIPLPAEIPHGA
jgi:hypothetical protein